jgi:phage baseplate assembly protein W
MSTIGRLEYIIKEGDTLESISRDFFNDQNLWNQIAVFNELSYPYILNVSNDQFANGYLKLYRDIPSINVCTTTCFWVQDSGVSGHFSVSPTASSVTGNYIRINSQVAKIISISGTGINPSSVILSSSVSSGVIDYITEENLAFLTIPVGVSVSTLNNEKTYSIIGDTNYIMYPHKDFIEVPIQANTPGLLGETMSLSISSLVTSITGVGNIINLEPIKVITNERHSTGVVTINRDTTSISTSDVIIPYGTIFKTTLDTDTQMSIREYYSTEEVVLSGDSLSVDVPVRCTESGNSGNVYSRKIGVISDFLIEVIGSDKVFVLNSSNIKDAFNNVAFYDGVTTNIKRAGDSIHIPSINDGIQTVTPISMSFDDIYDILLGEDIELVNGDLSIGINGDISTIKGIPNLSQSIKNRLSSPLGTSNLLHPDYGTLLLEYIGEPATPELVTVLKEEVIRTCKADQRVDSILAIGLATQDGVGIVDMDLRIIGSDTTQNMKFLVKRGV